MSEHSCRKYINRRRERGANYTQEERMIFLGLVKQYGKIINDKKNGAVLLKQKKEAWEIITQKYNSKCITGTREVEQLKALYDNIKHKARKNVCQNNAQLLITHANYGPKTSDEDSTDWTLTQGQVETVDNSSREPVYFNVTVEPEDIECEPQASTSITTLERHCDTEQDDDSLHSTLNITSQNKIEQDQDSINSSISSCSGVKKEQDLYIPKSVPKNRFEDEKKQPHDTPISAINCSGGDIKGTQQSIVTLNGLRNLYFKRKYLNACLERKKMLMEIFQSKQQHNLKMLILKKKLEKNGNGF